MREHSSWISSMIDDGLCNEILQLDKSVILFVVPVIVRSSDSKTFGILPTVSHSQITRLYSRFTSLDKGENGTLR